MHPSILRINIPAAGITSIFAMLVNGKMRRMYTDTQRYYVDTQQGIDTSRFAAQAGSIVGVCEVQLTMQHF